MTFTDAAAEITAVGGAGVVHNYCRNHDNEGFRKTIFCYYDATDDTKWEYCDPIYIPTDQGLSPEACSA